MSDNNEGTKPAWMPNSVYDFLKWAVLICLAILLAALLLGVFPLFGG